jgi:transposase
MIGIEYKPYVMEMGYLFPPSLADFLGSTDEVHVFIEVTEHLDVSHLDSDFNGMGQRPYHPLMLLRLLMWGMANRVVSTRRIEVLAHRDVSFIYMAGSQRPDYRTLARFRRRNAPEVEKLFKQTVILCVRLGMVNLGHIALDGTKIKANTSKHKAMSYGRMKQEEERLKKEIEELMGQAEAVDKEEDQVFGEENNGYNLPEELQRREQRLEKISQLREELEREKREEQELPAGASPQIEDKEQRSFADHDGRIMLMKSGGFDYAYNGQAGTDEGHGVIVVADLSNEAVDMGHLPEMVTQVRELREELEVNDEEDKQTEMSADSGYFSADNIRTEGEGIELLIASGRENKGPAQETGEGRICPVNRFDYDKNEDVWRCPEGRFLTRPIEPPRSEPSGLYRYTCADCNGCEKRQYCLKPHKDRRVLEVNKDQLLHGEMRARLRQPEKQAIYRKRKWVAEQTMGQIKGSLGFRGVTLRGKTYARAQWLFVCAVHNVMKAVRFISQAREATMKEVEATVALRKLSPIGYTSLSNTTLLNGKIFWRTMIIPTNSVSLITRDPSS